MALVTLPGPPLPVIQYQDSQHPDQKHRHVEDHALTSDIAPPALSSPTFTMKHRDLSQRHSSYMGVSPREILPSHPLWHGVLTRLETGVEEGNPHACPPSPGGCPLPPRCPMLGACERLHTRLT